MWLDQRGSELLSRVECRRLLALGAGGVAHLGLIVDGQPVVVPVNYTLLDRDVLLRLGPGTTLEELGHAQVVALEVDRVPPKDGDAWSVVVQGVATPLTDVDSLQRAARSGLVPLVPEPGHDYVQIRTGVLTGRRFSVGATGQGGGRGARGDLVPVPGEPGPNEAQGEPSVSELRTALLSRAGDNGDVAPGVAESLAAERGWTGRLMQVLRLCTQDSHTMGYLAGGHHPDEVASCVAYWAQTPLSLEQMALVIGSGGYDPDPFVTLARAGLLERALRFDGCKRRIDGAPAGAWLSDTLATASEDEIIQRTRDMIAASDRQERAENLRQAPGGRRDRPGDHCQEVES